LRKKRSSAGVIAGVRGKCKKLVRIMGFGGGRPSPKRTAMEKIFVKKKNEQPKVAGGLGSSLGSWKKNGLGGGESQVQKGLRNLLQGEKKEDNQKGRA